MGRTLAHRAAASALVVVAAGLALAPPAAATPPVTQDDHKWMYPNQARVIDVLANDSDPDGDDLDVCRLAPIPEDADYYVAVEDGSLLVFTGEATDDIVLTYYACDYETLVPATLTISFREIQPITVEKAARPGRLRVTNDNDRTVAFLYGSFDEPRPDGRVKVPAHGTVVVVVERHRIDWIAIIARSVLAGIGHVRGIELPGDRRRTAAPRLTRAEARVWTARSG